MIISHKGLLVEQRSGSAVRFLVFVASAKEIVRWAEADNIKIDRGSVQRALVEARWKQISKFFDANPSNVIPTSVTIALDDTVERVEDVALLEQQKSYLLDEVKDGLSEIRFSDLVKGSAFIIDGQHRLKGMSELSYDVWVPVCLFLELPLVERAFQFVTINNKSHKVPTGNLKALVANFDQIQSDLRTRLTQASITTPQFASAVDVLNENVDSPFHKLVAWVNNRFPDANPIVQPTALENSLKAIIRAFPETKDDEGEALVVLYAIWRAIFAEYGINATNAGDYPNLVMKATVQTISGMVVDKLSADFDPVFSDDSFAGNNGTEAARVAKALISGIPGAFWSEPWRLKSLDTSAGRALIEDDIRSVKKETRQAGGLPDDWRSRSRLFRQSMDEEEPA